MSYTQQLLDSVRKLETPSQPNGFFMNTSTTNKQPVYFPSSSSSSSVAFSNPGLPSSSFVYGNTNTNNATIVQPNRVLFSTPGMHNAPSNSILSSANGTIDNNGNSNTNDPAALPFTSVYPPRSVSFAPFSVNDSFVIANNQDNNNSTESMVNKGRPPATPHPSVAYRSLSTVPRTVIDTSSSSSSVASSSSSSLSSVSSLPNTPTNNLPLNLNDAYSIISSQRTVINQLRTRINDLDNVIHEYRDRVLNYEVMVSRSSSSLSQSTTPAPSTTTAMTKNGTIGSPSLLSTVSIKSPLQKYNLPQSPSFSLPTTSSSSSSDLTVLTEENHILKTKLTNQETEIQRLKEEKTTLLKNILDAAKKLEDYKIQTEKEKAQLAFKLGKESALAAMAQTVVSSSSSATVISPRPSSRTHSSAASVSSNRLSKNGDHHSVRSTKSSSKKDQSSHSRYHRHRSPSMERSDNDNDDDIVSRVSGVRDNLSDDDDDDEYIDDETTTVPDTNDLVSSSSSSSRRGRRLSPKHTASSSSSDKKLAGSSSKSKSSSISSSRSEEPEDTKGDGSVTPRSSSSAHNASNTNNVSTNSTIKASETVPSIDNTNDTAKTSNNTKNDNGTDTYPPTSPNLPTLSTAGLLARGEQLRQQEMLLLALKQQQAQTRMVALAHQKQQQYLLAMQNQYQSPASMFMQNNTNNSMLPYGSMMNNNTNNNNNNNTNYGTMNNNNNFGNSNTMNTLNMNNPNNRNMNYVPPTTTAASRFAAAGIDVTNGGYGSSLGYRPSPSLNNLNMNSIGSGIGLHSSTNNLLMTGGTTNGMYGPLNPNGLASGNHANGLPSNTMNPGLPNNNGMGMNNNNNGNTNNGMPNQPVSPLAGVKTKQLSTLQENLQVHNDGSVSISGTSGLPPGATHISMVPVANPPSTGWSVYQHPPWGTKWPDSIPFFAPLVEPGIPVMKHGRLGRPKRRLLWMDISNPSDPTLVWQEGEIQNIAKVKDKDRMRLIDILDIRAGRVGPVLERSGKEEDASRYISFSGENRTLDIELPTPEAREFVFKKFADLFQAYATAQLEKLSNDAITMRVAAIVDGGANSQPGSTAGLPPPPNMNNNNNGMGNNRPPPPSSQRIPPPPLSMM